MPSLDRRAAARRRAWGRGPTILRFEPLEGRQLLSTSPTQGPDQAATATTPLASDTTATPPAQATDPTATTALGTIPTATTALGTVPTATTAPGADATATTAPVQGVPASISVIPTSVTTPQSASPITISAAGGTVQPVTSLTQAPDLVATSLSTPNNLDWGDTFHATGSITNQGTATTTAPFEVDVYASASPTLDAQSVLVGTIEVPTGLTPGSSAKFDQVLTLPPSPIPGLGTNPSYYLTLNVDPNNAAGESNLQNNQGQGQGVDTTVVTITPHPVPFLIGTGITVSPTTANWGGVVTINANVYNVGLGNAPATRARVILTPNGQVPSADDFTIGSVDIPPVAPQQTVTASQAITLPPTPPTPLAGSTKFVVSLIEDADHQTTTGLGSSGRGLGLDQAWLQVNPGPAPVAINLLPDLSLAAVRGPQQLTWGQPFQVDATLQNAGHGDAGPFKVRFLLEDDDNPSLPPLAVVDTTIPGLKAGFAQGLDQTVNFGGKLPDGLTPGATVNAHVAVQVDPEHTLDEVSLANNTLDSGPVQLRLVGTDGNSVPAAATGPTVTPPPISIPISTPTPTPPPIIPVTTVPSTPTSTPKPGAKVIAHKAHPTPKPKAAPKPKPAPAPKKNQGLRIFPRIVQPSPAKHAPAPKKKSGKSY
jgi:hypothetical protein